MTPTNIQQLARLDFSEIDKSVKPNESDWLEDTSTQNAGNLPQESLANHQKPLEPVDFGDDQDSIDIQVGREFQKKPSSKLFLGLFGVGVALIGVGYVLNLGAQDAQNVLKKNESPAASISETKDKNVVPDSEMAKRAGSAESQLASKRLSEKLDAINTQKAKDKANKHDKATRPSPNRIASSPTSSSSDSSAPYRSTYIPSSPTLVHSVPSYQPSRQYSPYVRPASVRTFVPPSSYSQPQVQKEKPKMLAFGAMPDNGDKSVRPSVVTTQKTTSASSGYTPAVYTSPQGYDSRGEFLDQQNIFLQGDRSTRLSADDSANGEVTSEAILPGQFEVRLTSPLGSIPVGSTVIFESKNVATSGKIEANAVSILSGGNYQQGYAVPDGAIALYRSGGSLLKAKKSGGGPNVISKIALGAANGLASRFLSTDSTTSITDAGSITSSNAGGKGLTDLGLAALQGGVTPLLSGLDQPTADSTPSFTISPGTKVQVKVRSPFTLSY